MKRKMLFIPHGNIQYSQLAPEKREWVVRNSYERLFNLLLENKKYKIGFEGSGETIRAIAELCPDVLEKLNTLIKNGQIEPIGSPYTHIMLANIDPEIGLHTLKDGIDAWEKYTGIRPKTGWNPECSWASFIPEIFKEAGFENLIMDGDSFFLSFKDVRDATGLKFDVKGHSNKNHLFKIEEYIKDKKDYLKYITNPSVASNGLKMIFRSDFMANPMLWYLMGATEGLREEPVKLEEIKYMMTKWQKRIDETGSFIMPYAEDAEYIGTTAYFYVKQFGQARFFEHEPQSVDRFKEMLDTALECGYELSTPSEIISSANEIIENKFIENVENGIAWHGGTAKAWANTEYARIMDPVCKSMFDGIKAINQELGKNLDSMDEYLVEARKAVTSAYVSDSRWPPAPTSPGRFNVRESIDDMYKANLLIEKSMIKNNIENLKSLYSPSLMKTQIKAIEDILMSMEYFGEKK
jgi:hypothetical protein